MIAKFILGTKGSMKQVFTDKGERIPVTQVHTSPCYVVDLRTQDRDGYWAVKLGFGTAKNIKKSANGLLKKAGIKTPLRFLREVRLSDDGTVSALEGKQKGIKVGNLEIRVGDELKSADLFAMGDAVHVTGTSKGKGFQGVVKRHGFAGGPRTHGQSDRERAPGSIGMSATPGRVLKGKKMAGRMGSDTVTVKNLQVIEVEGDALTLKGLIPGVFGGLIVIKSPNPVAEKQEAAEQEAEPEVESEVEVEPIAEPTADSKDAQADKDVQVAQAEEEEKNEQKVEEVAEENEEAKEAKQSEDKVTEKK